MARRNLPRAGARPRAKRSPSSAEAATAGAFVYVIACRTPRGALTYVGWTLDPGRRLAEHNAGRGAKSTRGRAWFIIYVEAFPTRQEAMRREWHLKRDRKLRRRLLAAWLDRAGAPV